MTHTSGAPPHDLAKAWQSLPRSVREGLTRLFADAAEVANFRDEYRRHRDARDRLEAEVTEKDRQLAKLRAGGGDDLVAEVVALRGRVRFLEEQAGRREPERGTLRGRIAILEKNQEVDRKRLENVIVSDDQQDALIVALGAAQDRNEDRIADLEVRLRRDTP